MNITKNGAWIDVLPTLMIDWGNGKIRIFIGWIYWTLEIRFN